MNLDMFKTSSDEEDKRVLYPVEESYNSVNIVIPYWGIVVGCLVTLTIVSVILVFNLFMMAPQEHIGTVVNSCMGCLL